MFLDKCILLLLVALKMAQTSALQQSEGFSAAVAELESLPPPLPPINDANNITDILKKLPLPSQQFKQENDTEKIDDENGLSKAAEWLRNSLNQSVSPCEDFYEFTCGKWLANTQIPAGEQIITPTSQHFNLTKYYDLFKDPKPSSSMAINKAKSLFRACMNYDRTKRSELLERINEFGGWPILRGSEWDPECFNLPHLLAMIRRSLGSCYYFGSSCNIFMGSVVDQNRYNASQQAIYFEQSHLGLKWPENYKNGTKLEEYAQRIMNMVKVVASDAEAEFCEEKIRHEINKVVDFEKRLSNIIKPYKIFNELVKSYKIGRLSKLAKVLPELNLTEYFKALLPIKASFHEYFASDPEVFFDDIYFGKLNLLLAKTNKTTLANYVMLRYVMEWSNRHLDGRLNSEKAERTDKLGMNCVDRLIQELEDASGALYVRKFVGNESKNAVLEMVYNIRVAFRTILDQDSWMDPVTKKRAIRKLDKLIPHIGYPDLYLNDTELDAYYEELNFEENDSYSTMLQKKYKFDITKEYQKLLAPTNRHEFHSTIYTTAQFERTLNIINIPPGNFLPPRFDKLFPKAMNYGGLGMLIGHELTHGFDDVGSNYDELGNERNWWEPETKANFMEKKKCLIYQYSAYRVPELNKTLNGTQTVVENIADNGGIKAAYMAYKIYLKKHENEEGRLTGFDHFTNEQLFFINFGISWCANRSVQQHKLLMKIGAHSPHRYRVNGPLSNMPDFAATFNCPKGSPMNPEKKCRLW